MTLAAATKFQITENRFTTTCYHFQDFEQSIHTFNWTGEDSFQIWRIGQRLWNIDVNLLSKDKYQLNISLTFQYTIQNLIDNIHATNDPLGDLLVPSRS